MLNQRLVIRIIWHEAFEKGLTIGQNIYSAFCRDVKDPASQSIGIPVYFHTHDDFEKIEIFNDQNLECAQTTAIIALLDNNVRAESSWYEGIQKLEQQISQTTNKCLFFPIACERRTTGLVESTNCITFYNENYDELIMQIMHELARTLLNQKVTSDELKPQSPLPVKLFLSHSKHDDEGPFIAETLRDRGRRHHRLATFIDVNDIPPGCDFEGEILSNILGSVLIVIHTDSYSSRAWCQKEVLNAKLQGCPSLLVNAITRKEVRLFPYLGNSPVIRWNSNADPDSISFDVFYAAIKEALRVTYFTQQVSLLKKQGIVREDYIEVGVAPELLNYINLVKQKKCNRTRKSVILYPDPPLSDDEAELMESINPSWVSLTTPTSASIPGIETNSVSPLQNKKIGISISQAEDIRNHGLSELHLEDAMVEIARHMLAQGAHLAYGGDLRSGGFTQILCELVRRHGRPGPSQRIHNYLAWPIFTKKQDILSFEYLNEVNQEKVCPPEDIEADIHSYIMPTDFNSRYMWARSLTTMRSNMTEDIYARVVLGGQTLKYVGKYPGIMEETIFSLKKQKPIYLLGGFGGCAHYLTQAILGVDIDDLNKALNFESEKSEAFAKYFNHRIAKYTNIEPIDYKSDLYYISSVGFGGLNNGLSESDNKVLFSSRNLPEIIHLILKGLVTALVKNH